ncbi:unnamed protein product [Porites evermanni]|uniref:Uncharacterized protein n=1 Tax=Porites evermanni TaxID=104178 RepID=A0ABN8RY42_9CNID|nr:unnamed protein product [Porites evermanni]
MHQKNSWKLASKVYAPAWAFAEKKDDYCTARPSSLIDKLLSYILQVRRLSQGHEYQPSCIIAMDETPVWDDMVLNTTYLNSMVSGWLVVSKNLQKRETCDRNRERPL